MIPVADLIPDPTISWDYVRLANVFLAAILIGEVGNVLWHYRGIRSRRALHVRLVGYSSATYAAAVAYGSIRVLGHPALLPTAGVQLLALVGGVTGIAGTYLILRSVSGKAEDAEAGGVRGDS